MADRILPLTCGLLILTLPLQQLPSKIHGVLEQISQMFGRKLLYIKIEPTLGATPFKTPSRLDLIKFMPTIYQAAINVDSKMDVRILNPIDNQQFKYKLRSIPDLIITTNHEPNASIAHLKEYISGRFQDLTKEGLLYDNVCPNEDESVELATPTYPTVGNDDQNKTYDNVCLGGTFDGIHVGHKIMFSEATLRCNKKIVVGVTDTNLTKSKILWEIIKPLDERLEEVEEYLKEIDPSIQREVVPISDMYGPTLTQRDLQYLVVSEETLKGGEKVNTERQRKGWPSMDVGIVPLLHDNQDLMTKINEKKVSSSTIRLSRLGTIIRPPKPNLSIPRRPYLIGLTGGIASGKTAIGHYLESLGLGYINYDLLGHQTYAIVDSPVYKNILQYFGDDILKDDGSQQVDRGKLGKVVFGDKEKLEKLNSIVWPAIYDLVQENIDKMKEEHDIIVLESALLIESKQTERVHQVWVTIVPRDEAIKRLMNSRNLSVEDAEQRVGSQIDNITRVKQANVVFCSMWEREFTQQQVRKALDELKMNYLE